MTTISTEEFVREAIKIFHKHLKGDVLDICIEATTTFAKERAERTVPISVLTNLSGTLGWAFPFSSNAGNISSAEWYRLRSMTDQHEIDKFCEQYDSTFKYDIFDKLEKKLANEN